MALGLLLVTGGATGAVMWHLSATATTSVVVAARPIPRGTEIGPDDLTAVKISGGHLQLVEAGSAATLLGQVAAVDVDAGTPLSEAVIDPAAPLGAAEALSSVAVEPGWVPSDLAVGDAVRIVVVALEPGGEPVATLVDAPLAVWAVSPPDEVTGASVVTLRGPLELATQLATAQSVQIARVSS